MPSLQRTGLTFYPDEAGYTGTLIYLPISLRATSPLYLRTLWAKIDEDPPPLPTGDVVTEVTIYSFNELTDTFVLEDTIEEVVTFSDAFNEREHYYSDIDVSGYCAADTSHFFLLFARLGDDQRDDLDFLLTFINSRTLLAEV